jgi:hypothetical protein
LLGTATVRAEVLVLDGSDYVVALSARQSINVGYANRLFLPVIVK